MTEQTSTESEESIFEEGAEHLENTMEGEEPEWWWIYTLFGIFTLAFYGAILYGLI